MNLAKKYYVDQTGDMIRYTRFRTGDKIEQSAETFHAKLKIIRVTKTNNGFYFELQDENGKTSKSKMSSKSRFV